MAQPGRLSFSRYYRQFSSNVAFSNQSLFWLSLPFIGTTLVLDFGRLAGYFSQWLFVSTIGYLAMLGAAFLIRPFFFNHKIRTGFYLPTFFLLGTVRGLFIYLVGTAIDVVPTSEFLYRFIGSGIFSFCMMPIFAILVSNFERANQTQATLEAQRLRRANRLNSMKLEIAEQKSEIVGRVNGLIAPVIADLIDRLKVAKSSDMGKEISALTNTVETVVRPISQSIGRTNTTLSEPALELASVSLFTRLLPKGKLQVAALLLPGLSAFLMTLVATPSMLNIAGTANGLIGLGVMSSSTFFLIQVTKWSTNKLNLSAIPALLVAEIPYLGVGIVTSVWVYVLNENLYAIAMPRVITLTLVFGAVFFIAQSRYQMLNQNNEALASVNQELEMLNAQAKQELWVNRRRIATVLHGPVQAALYASAIRLAQSKKPTKKLIQEVNAELAEALKALNFDQADVPTVKSVLDEITEVWSGICEIYVSIPKNVHDAINRNPNVAESFTEVVREAVSNAIKHGGAKDIEIAAKIQQGIIQLQVTNNGKAPTSKQASSGYGTQILNELTLSWELATSKSGKTQFNASIVAAN